jgi:hypothetical protein
MKSDIEQQMTAFFPIAPFAKMGIISSATSPVQSSPDNASARPLSLPN